MAATDSDTLETLSRLLKSHRETLAALYDGLGAPPTTVEVKLRDLHTALVQTIASQREAAQQEVNAVQEEVCQIKADVALLRTSLGEPVTVAQGDDNKVRDWK